MLNIRPKSTDYHFGQFELDLANSEGGLVNCSFKYQTNLCVLEKSTS